MIDVLYPILVRSAIGGLLLLALATLALGLIRQPARRIRVIELTLGGLLALPVLSLIPGYPQLAVLPTVELATVELATVELAAVELATVKLAAVELAAVELDDSDALAFVREPEEQPAGPVPATTFREVRVDVTPLAIAIDEPVAVSTDAVAVEPRIYDVELPSPATTIAAPWNFDFEWRTVLVYGYLLAVSISLAWSLLGLLAVGRLLRRSRPADAACRAMLRSIAGPASERVPLLVSPIARQPCAVAWRPAAIVLPADLHGPDAMRWALAHEWSHVSRGDVWLWAGSSLVRALYFYQPLIWRLRRQLQLCQDYLADDAAARAGGAAEDYAEFLATISAGISPSTLAVGLGIGGHTTDLERRVVMLVENSRPLETRPPRRWNLLIAALSLALLGVISMAAPRTTIAAKDIAPKDFDEQQAPAAEDRTAQQVAEDRATAINQMKDLAQAMNNHHDAKQRFPGSAAFAAPDGTGLLSWRVALLPFLGQEELYKKFHLNEPWDSAHNLELSVNMPEIFKMPGSKAAAGLTVYQVPRGEQTAFPPKGSSSLRQISDGSSKTILIVETDDAHAVAWTKPDDWDLPGEALLKGLGGHFPDVILMVFADATLHLFPDKTDDDTSRAFFTRSGREPIQQIPPEAALPGRAGVERIARQGDDINAAIEQLKKLGIAMPQDDDINAAINQLKELGIAMLNHHDAFKKFPPIGPYVDKSGKPLLSWRVRLLPFLEQTELYKRFHLDEPWDSAHNSQLIRQMPAVYRLPGSKAPPGTTVIQAPVGEHTMFAGGKATMETQVTDGLSTTILLVETDDAHAVPWTKPADWEFVPDHPKQGLGGHFPKMVLTLFADGSVNPISNEVRMAALRALFTRDGNEMVRRNSAGLIELAQQPAPGRGSGRVLPEASHGQARPSGKIKPGDMISIEVYVPEGISLGLKATPIYTVDDDGQINLGSRYGSFAVAGKSLDEIGEDLHNRLEYKLRAETYDKSPPMLELIRHLNILVSRVQQGAVGGSMNEAMNSRGGSGTGGIGGGGTGGAGGRGLPTKLEPARIEPGQVLQIAMDIDEPVGGGQGRVVLVEADGNIALGVEFGRVNVAGKTFVEAEEAIRAVIMKTYDDAKVQVTQVRNSAASEPSSSSVRLEKELKESQDEVRRMRREIEALNQRLMMSVGRGGDRGAGNGMDRGGRGNDRQREMERARERELQMQRESEARRKALELQRGKELEDGDPHANRGPNVEPYLDVIRRLESDNEVLAEILESHRDPNGDPPRAQDLEWFLGPVR